MDVVCGEVKPTAKSTRLAANGFVAETEAVAEMEVRVEADAEGDGEDDGEDFPDGATEAAGLGSATMGEPNGKQPPSAKPRLATTTTAPGRTRPRLSTFIVRSLTHLLAAGAGLVTAPATGLVLLVGGVVLLGGIGAGCGGGIPQGIRHIPQVHHVDRAPVVAEIGGVSAQPIGIAERRIQRVHDGVDVSRLAVHLGCQLPNGLDVHSDECHDVSPFLCLACWSVGG
jgi:hypothetical protein